LQRELAAFGAGQIRLRQWIARQAKSWLAAVRVDR